jgi:glutathione S-transferase
MAALAVFLWLRSQGTFDEVGTAGVGIAPAESASRSASVGPDSLPTDAVEPASAAQLAFLNEVLTDTTRTLEHGFVVASRRHDTAYYLAARMTHADTSAAAVGLWFMRGPRDAPRSVKAINAVGAQHALAGRVDPAQERVTETDAEAQRLLEYFDDKSGDGVE